MNVIIKSTSIKTTLSVIAIASNNRMVSWLVGQLKVLRTLSSFCSRDLSRKKALHVHDMQLANTTEDEEIRYSSVHRESHPPPQLVEENGTK